MTEYRLLLTGFGAFPGVPHNPTEAVAATLQRARLGPWRVHAETLPVSFTRAAATVRRLWAEQSPDGLLMMGVAAQANTLRLETRAINAAAARIPDVDGRQLGTLSGTGGATPTPTGISDKEPPEPRLSPEPLDPTAEWNAVLPGQAPFDVLRHALETAGFPAALSDDAGRYVCNATYYAALDRLSRDRRVVPVLFLHVPPVNVVDPTGAPWDLARLREAVQTLIAALPPPA